MQFSVSKFNEEYRDPGHWDKKFCKSNTKVALTCLCLHLMGLGDGPNGVFSEQNATSNLNKGINIEET